MARNVVCSDGNVKSAVHIHHIFVSGGHNFFGRHGQAPGTHAMTDVAAVRCRAGLGLEGDRFFGYKPDYSGQVTFFAWDVYAEARRELARPELPADAFRRNVLISGVALNDLIGARFTLDGIEFEGVSEAKPCYWMDHVIAPGAERWLRGRGGLRARILTDGELHRGPVALHAPGLLALG